MTTTLGVLLERSDAGDLLWNQCDGPYGQHGAIEVYPGLTRADHVLLIGVPLAPGQDPRLGLRARLAANLRGDRRRRKLHAAWEALALPRERTTVLFYEPAPSVGDVDIEVAQEHAGRVFGTDGRAAERLDLPSLWLLPEDVHTLRALPPPKKPVGLAVVTSGRMVVPGHGPRLEFLRHLRRAGVAFELFGRGLPTDLAPRGSVQSKSSVLLPARFALALENHAADDGYVTEKLWDPLLCWSLPLYHGGSAAERLLPPGCFVRLPDLAQGGVAAVRAALAQPGLWEERLEAIAEARRRILGPLRMVEWARGLLG